MDIIEALALVIGGFLIGTYSIAIGAFSEYPHTPWGAFNQRLLSTARARVIA